MNPFLTFYAPTFRRPLLGERCKESVRRQTLAPLIQFFGPEDLIGHGIEGMYATVPMYASCVRGDYVHLLADDDELIGPEVVAEVRDFADQWGYPPVIVVKVAKQMDQGWLVLPLDAQGPPLEGRIDLGCLIVRQDVWKAHCHQYGRRYEGDFDFAHALWSAGHAFKYADIFFLKGGVMRGRPE